MKNPFTYWRERHQQAVEDLQQEIGLNISRALDIQRLDEKWERIFSLYLKQQTVTNHENSAKWFVVDMLVTSHPEPELLLHNWNLNLPNVVDELHDNLPGEDSDELRQVALDAWQRTLKRYTDLIERTAQARRQGGPTPAEMAQVNMTGALYMQRAMMDMLISTHLEPKWLQRTWQANFPQPGELPWSEPSPFGDEAFKQELSNGWQGMAQHFTQVIECAVEANHGEQGDDES
jgi:hypothetical protein